MEMVGIPHIGWPRIGFIQINVEGFNLGQQLVVFPVVLACGLRGAIGPVGTYLVRNVVDAPGQLDSFGFHEELCVGFAGCLLHTWRFVTRKLRIWRGPVNRVPFGSVFNFGPV
jgi:hypothetical protein